MGTWLQRNPLIVALGLLAAALLVVLAIEAGFSARSSSVTASKRGVAAEAKLLPPLPQVAPEQAYAETATRPLFVPTRRPAPEVVAAAAPAFQRGQFTLQGVIVAGNNRTAMLREKTSGRVHRVETGKEVNGIKVVQIDPHVVTLGVGEEREVVPLSVQRPGSPGAAAAPSPAVAASVVQGPFGAPSPAFPVAGTQPQPGTPGMVAGQPLPSRGAIPFPAAPQSASPAPAVPGAVAPGAPGAPPQASTAPMSPEELLARRRARRAQQTQ